MRHLLARLLVAGVLLQPAVAFGGTSIELGGVGTLDSLTDVEVITSVSGDHLCKSGSDTWIPCAAAAPGVHATSHQPGGSDIVNDVVYTPADIAHYGGADPGDMKEALDYLAGNLLLATPWKRYDRWYDWTTGRYWDGSTLTTITNRCQGSQRVIARMIQNPTSPGNYYIGGTGTVTTEDYKDLAGTPTLAVCMAFMPGTVLDANGYPEDSTTATINPTGIVNFDFALNATIDNAAQDDFSEFMRWGNVDRVGFVDATSNEFTAGGVHRINGSGFILAHTTADRDGDQGAGAPDPVVIGELPRNQFHSTGAKTTTHIMWQEAGMTRSNFSALTRYYASDAQFDWDDFGEAHSIQGWVLSYGPTSVYWMGVGIYGFGNWDGNHSGGEIAGNTFGLVYDNLFSPGSQEVWSSCAKGTTFCDDRPQASTLALHTFENMTIEGNRANELAIGAVKELHFENVWLERNGLTVGGTAGTGGSSTVLDNLTGFSLPTGTGGEDGIGSFLWNYTDNSWCRISSITDSNTATCESALSPSGSFDNGDVVAYGNNKGHSQIFGAGLDSAGRVCAFDNEWAAASGACTWQAAHSNYASYITFKGGHLAPDRNMPKIEGITLGPFAVSTGVNYYSLIEIESDYGLSDTDTDDATFTTVDFVANAASRTIVEMGGSFSQYPRKPPAGYPYAYDYKRKSPRTITAMPVFPAENFTIDEVVIVGNGSARGDCDPGAPTGSVSTFCKWNGSALESVGGFTFSASGDIALGVSSIASGACASAATDAATGVLTTDIITWTPTADLSAVTGYSPLTSGSLIIYPYPTANNVNFKVCNPTTSAITPGAVTLNWRVIRP